LGKVTAGGKAAVPLQLAIRDFPLKLPFVSG